MLLFFTRDADGGMMRCSASAADRYRAVDHQGQVVVMLLQAKRDQASAEAFPRHVLKRTDTNPHTIISDHHQSYVKAVTTTLHE
jgi:transposase-like protein